MFSVSRGHPKPDNTKTKLSGVRVAGEDRADGSGRELPEIKLFPHAFLDRKKVNNTFLWLLPLIKVSYPDLDAAINVWSKYSHSMITTGICLTRLQTQLTLLIRNSSYLINFVEMFML